MKMWIKAKGANVDSLPERAFLAYLNDEKNLVISHQIFDLVRNGPVSSNPKRAGVIEKDGMWFKYRWEGVDASDIWDCDIISVELDDVVAFWPVDVPEMTDEVMAWWAEKDRER